MLRSLRHRLRLRSITTPGHRNLAAAPVARRQTRAAVVAVVSSPRPRRAGFRWRPRSASTFKLSNQSLCHVINWTL